MKTTLIFAIQQGTMRHRTLFNGLFFLTLLLASPAFGFDSRVLGAGQKPNDKRLAKAVTLHDYHPFRPLASGQTWEKRQRDIQHRVRLASGLLPEPDRTPLQVVISDKVEKEGFAIQKVYFESFPGHFVTGTLFSPAGDSLTIGVINGKRPVVLCPHGHWKDGRFHQAPAGSVLGELARGGERFANAAINPIHSRCVQLARMGCLVFLYDTLGNADSVQFAEHRHGPREEMNQLGEGQWGFVSPQSILRLQTNFGLQNWNSIRALDMILELPEADPDRVLVTGASGGATQTMMIAAIDDRVDASFPCVMVSTAMQGGCTCENAHYLRIDQGNIDIAAAAAPKPLGLTAADDWTIELKTKGHPDLLNLYQTLGAPTAYEAHFDIHFKHNYNHVSRTHMYQFVNRHFKLGLKSPVLESDYVPLTREELTVWSTDGTRPANYRTGAEHERDLNRVWARDGADKVRSALEKGGPDLDLYREGWNIILRRQLSDLGEVSFDLVRKEKLPGFIVMNGLIRHPDASEELPALFYYPETWNGEVVLIPTATGKNGLFLGDPATPTDQVRKRLEGGQVVVGVDLFAQGEFLAEGEMASLPSLTYSGKADVKADSWERSPVYYYGYNDSIFVRRVHDLLTTIKMIQTRPDWQVKKMSLHAEGPLAAVALAAVMQSGKARAQVEADLKGFEFGTLNDSWNEHFVPGAVRLGDVAMLKRLASGE